MIFPEYELFRWSFVKTQTALDSVLTEKEALFMRTQPAGQNFDRERVSGGKAENTFDRYLIEAEKRNFDERIEALKGLLEERRKLLEDKEKELRASAETLDRVYLYRFREHRGVRWISQRIGYSEPQVYRFIRRVSLELKMIKNDR